MRKKNFHARWLVIVLLCITISAQSYASSPDSTYWFRIYIGDTTYFPTVTPSGSYVTVTFPHDSRLTAIVSAYNITEFAQEGNGSRHEFMKHYWLVAADSPKLMTDILNYNPYIFPIGYLLPGFEDASYPNDYGKASSGYQGNLDMIKVSTVWNDYGDTGNSSVIIGDVDTYFDTTNPDLRGQIARNRRDIFDSTISHPNHGTATAGCAAGATNNDTLLANVCSGCRLDVSNNPNYSDAPDTFLRMSEDGDRVLNASYINCGGANTLDEQIKFDEIYENNAVMVAAAGNGVEAGCTTSASEENYPASYGHSFSVTSVGYDSTAGVTYNVRYLHEETEGDTASTHTHNPRVDICAAGYNVPVLISGAVNGTGKYVEYADGTSFASPTVAGACGLVISANPHLSAYQVKYIVKSQANTIIYTKPANFSYINQLGYGVLNVGNAVAFVESPVNENFANNPAFQTMDISGVEINTICAPGFSTNGVIPELTPVIVNGIPPYTYTWYSLGYNHTTLNDIHSSSPTIDSSWGDRTADYYLVVTDNSPVEQQRASRHIHIALDTVSDMWDLASRDSYLDMLDEPNSQATVDPRQWQVWESPDVWNRIANDGGTTHQDPQYFNPTTPNYAYTRIRNVGCADAPGGAQLHLYWTKASTGEIWPGDWDTATFNHWPAGGEITNTPIILPALAPGEDTIVSHPWYPPRPQNYDSSLTAVEVCFLSRIKDGHNTSDTDGMTYVEVPHLTTDVVENNNIVTRNMTVYNVTGFGRFVQVIFGNSEDATQTFNLKIETDKYVNKQFAGDISKIFSGIVLHLSATMYNNWVAHGSIGNYASKNAGAHTVTFSPVSDFMELGNIPLTALEKEPVKIEFQLTPTADTLNFAPQNLNIIQELVSGSTTSIYGDVTYEIVPAGYSSARMAPASVPVIATPTASLFGIYPNPTDGSFTLITKEYHDKATIIITDVMGREIKSITFDFGSTDRTTIDLGQCASGIYNVRIIGNKGVNEVLRVTKE